MKEKQFLKALSKLSLKKRLVFSFVGVVLFSAALNALIFTVVLVGTMKKSTREKLTETLKVAFQRLDDITRGLEIYTDLISSDMTFGQILSFDSSLAITQKIGEFQRLSNADVVAFIPKPEQYLQIKNKIFINSGKEALVPSLKKSDLIRNLLHKAEKNTQKGWSLFVDNLFIFAMKPVLHFGTNMGVIFLARQAGHEFAQDIASATGTGIVLFNESKVFGTSLKLNDKALKIPEMEVYGTAAKVEKLVEDYNVEGQSYFSLFAPITNIENEYIAKLALLVSTGSIREAQHRTLRRALVVAALTTILSALIGYILARAISNPIQNITRGIQNITERGDLSIRIPGRFGAEIGILASSFNRLLGRLQETSEKLAASEQRMKKELTMASTVQEMLFPPKVIRYGDLELASFIDSSTETGGDWFGYAQDRLEKNVSVMIGDVTGHGMSAALITAITNGFFKGVQEAEDAFRLSLADSKNNSQLKKEIQKTRTEVATLNGDGFLSTAEMLAILNRILLESTQGNLLMTFFASVLDLKQMKLRYANAGHNRPFLCKIEGGKVVKSTVLMSPPSQRLGERAKVQYEESQQELSQGDMILWYTDGLLECENPHGEAFGKRRMLQLIRKYGHLPAEEVCRHITSIAYEFFEDVPRKDDITLVVGKIL